MGRYCVYLETSEQGLCMAHVLELPGCIVRAASQDDALAGLPEAIRAYQGWLHRHGELSTVGDKIQIDVIEVATGIGPFNPGDAAALFAADRQAITIQEMENWFRLMSYSRQDLLALVGQLPEEILEWKPDPVSSSILNILRHIGNAEEWYISRIVAPETLPPEWDNDENLPIFTFLKMERRTAIERLRRLNETERAEVFYPSQWTEHPTEAWTARKVFRRFLEHEREHTAQIQEILGEWIVKNKA